jgi:carbohydrate kinase (thermoresistant glucokinase family)
LRVSGGAELPFVYLVGKRALLLQRVSERTGHFMPISLLDSQLATLEPPGPGEQALCCDVAAPVAQIVADALRWLRPGQRFLGVSAD